MLRKLNQVRSELITYCFYAAGFINLFGVLLFSKAFTSTVFFEADPVVMSHFGLVIIMLWGLAYLAVAKTHQQNKWLVGTFFLEKIVYIIAWVIWLLNNDLAPLYEKDFLAGLFYSIYGLNDFIFAVFFLLVFLKAHLSKS